MFDSARVRFYTGNGSRVAATDPATGTESVLYEGAEDLPPYDPSLPLPNVLSLSRSGSFLYVASSSGKLVRYNFATGQIDLRLDPPAGSPAGTRVVAVQASTTSDGTVFALLCPCTPFFAGTATATIAEVRNGAWSPSRLDLGVAPGGSMVMKPDGTEILYSAGRDSRRIRIGPTKPEGFEAVDMPMLTIEYDSNPPAPRYLDYGLLWDNRIVDPNSFTTLVQVPGARTCAPLPTRFHVVCVGGERPAAYELFVFDLEMGRRLTSWLVDLEVNQFSSQHTSGWISEAGSGRVAVQTFGAVKGIQFGGTGVFFHPALN